MATTTPNYGWSVPTSTDLVKDGATAIETLGDAIDASMNTALGTKKAGMVLLNTTSFSGVSSQSVNDVFSSTYRNYLILFQATGSTGIDVNVRLRVAGADNSSANYRRQTLDSSSTTTGSSRNTGETSWTGMMSIRSGVRNPVPVYIFQPFETEHTAAFSTRLDSINGNIEFRQVAHGVDVTTSYTGYSLICSTGNMTGVVSTYGFNV